MNLVHTVEYPGPVRLWACAPTWLLRRSRPGRVEGPRPTSRPFWVAGQGTRMIARGGGS